HRMRMPASFPQDGRGRLGSFAGEALRAARFTSLDTNSALREFPCFLGIHTNPPDPGDGRLLGAVRLPSLRSLVPRSLRSVQAHREAPVKAMRRGSRGAGAIGPASF